MLNKYPFQKTIQQRLWREACEGGFGQLDSSAGHRDLINHSSQKYRTKDLTSGIVREL